MKNDNENYRDFAGGNSGRRAENATQRYIILATAGDSAQKREPDIHRLRTDIGHIVFQFGELGKWPPPT